MKKKVLFALIALFSVLSAWADDVTAGTGDNAYKVSLSTQYVALTDATNGVAAPTIAESKVYKGTESFDATVASVVDASGNLVDKTAIKAAGIYYLLVNFTEESVAKVFKVPFYVTAPSNAYDFIKDKASWDASVESGALNLYYTKYPWEDLWGHPTDVTPAEADRYGTLADRRCEFTSYADVNKETQYATGTVKFLKQPGDGGKNSYQVQVLTNSVAEANFVGNTYYLEADAVVDGTTVNLLYSDADCTTAVDGIYVTLSNYGAWGFAHAWEGAINATDAKFPWICPNYNGDPKLIAFTYEDKGSVFPWGKATKFGTGAKDDGSDRLWGIASVAEEFKNNTFLLPETNYNGNGDWAGSKPATASAFVISKFNMLLIPADLVLTAEVSNATVLTATEADYDRISLPYIGAKQQPTFSGADANCNVFIKATATANQIDLVKDRDYTVTYLPDAEDKYINVGTHTFTINFIGNYTGSLNASYKIEKAHVNLNLAYIYKTYGEADPVAPVKPVEPASEEAIEAYKAALTAYTNKLGFEIDASTPLKGADVKSDIAKFLIFKRASGEQNKGETVKEYEYYYDKTADFEDNCNYSVSFLQTKSLLIIQKAPLHVKVTNDNKMWGQNDPSFADYTIVSGLVKNEALGLNDTKDNVTITITRPSASEDLTADGEQINADKVNNNIVFRNQATEGYPFAGEATNYNIIFDNSFAITPSTNTSGITVTFAETSYPYTGVEQKPTPIVKDGGKDLSADDYELDTSFDSDGYKDNLNVGTATCQIKLKGHYIATGDASKKTGTFAITKVTLNIYPQSYDAERPVPVGGYEVVYDGFVHGETAASETAKNTTGENAVTYFKTPDAPIVTKGEAIAQDVYALVIKKEGWEALNYDIKLKNGILALNDKPVIYAYPDPQTQVYTGTVDKELTFATYTDRSHRAENKMPTNPVTAVIGQPAYVIAKEDPTNANVGQYDITLRGTTVLKDYNVIYDDLTDGYEITRKGLTLKAINASKIYGDADPTFDALVYDGETAWTREQMNAAGIINNGPNNTGYWVGCGSWQNNSWSHSEDVDKYPIQVGLFSRNYGNYTITTTTNGEFEIKPFAVQIKADDKTKQFGEGDPQLTVTITDNNDATGHTIGAEVSRQIRRELRDYRVISRPDARTENGEAVGHHEIIVKAPTTGQAPNVTELKPRNYTITFVNGDLNITKALMIVKANDQYVDYGKEPNPYDVTITTSTRTLKWQKAGKDGLSAEKEAINAQIKDLVELSVLPGKNMMGGNENAYKLTVKESGSYALAKEGDFGNQTIEGDPFEVINAGTYVEGFCNGWLTVYPLTRIPLGKEALAEVLGIDLEKNPTAEVNLQKVLKDHKGLEGIEVILPARKMEADQWYEWVLPFDVTPRDFFYPYYDDEEELVEPIWGYGAIDVLDVAKSKSGKVVFSAQVANTIKANTPFIVKVDETIAAKDMEKISFTMQGDRVIADFDYVNNDPESVSNDKSVKFVGLYYDKTGIASNQLYLAKASGHTDREFWPGGETAKDLTLVRTKAYLEFPTAEAAQRAIILVEDENGTTTEITGVEADAEVAYGEGWYTITGVKLDAEPVTTGTYIFNGKKVFIQK